MNVPSTRYRQGSASFPRSGACAPRVTAGPAGVTPAAAVNLTRLTLAHAAPRALGLARVASTRDWFESVAEARRRARRRLPRPVFMALEAGAEAGVTRADNVAAFGEIRFAPPRLADLPPVRDLRTSVLGTEIALPVIASPVGAQAVHPLGEVAVAMGTLEAGTAMGLSEFASRPVADVASVNPRVFFQVHWSADRDVLLARAESARAAGATALIVTLDWSFPGGRDWGSPAIPERLGLRALAQLAPAGLARPGYLFSWLRHGGPSGVRNVFELLRAGIDSALLALGRPSGRDLVPADVILPADFGRGLTEPG